MVSIAPYIIRYVKKPISSSSSQISTPIFHDRSYELRLYDLNEKEESKSSSQPWRLPMWTLPIFSTDKRKRKTITYVPDSTQPHKWLFRYRFRDYPILSKLEFDDQYHWTLNLDQIHRLMANTALDDCRS